MNKQILLLLVIIILSSNVVIADNVLSFEDAKVYIDGKSAGTFEDGDDVNNVLLDKTLRVKVKLKNDANFKIRNVYVMADISGMGVNAQESAEVELDPGDTTYRYVSWTIPDDIDYDIYDLKIECRARNLTDSGVKYTDNATLFLDVSKDANSEQIDKNEEFINLTKEIKFLADSVNQTSDYYNHVHEDYIQCIDSKSMLISQKDRYKESRDECKNETDALLSRMDTCTDNLEKNSKTITQLRDELNTCNICENNLKTEKDNVAKANKDRNMFAFLGLILGIVGGMWWRGRNQEQPEELDDMPEV